MMKCHHAATLLGLALAGCDWGQEQSMPSFSLASTAFADGQPIPADYSCDGKDRSPPLRWSNPPPGTRSFAMVVDDPDAPGGIFRHWGAWNIPGEASGLDEGQSEGFQQARNDFGKPGYGGACPPRGHGPHRYRFKLLALDADKLDLPAESRIEEVEKAAARHLLGTAELTGTYERR